MQYRVTGSFADDRAEEPASLFDDLHVAAVFVLRLADTIGPEAVTSGAGHPTWVNIHGGTRLELQVSGVIGGLEGQGHAAGRSVTLPISASAKRRRRLSEAIFKRRIDAPVLSCPLPEWSIDYEQKPSPAV